MSLADVLGAKPQPPVAAPATASVSTEPKPNTALLPSIRTGALAGLFAKYPYDGTAKTYFPRVAVTVTDWSRNDCWIAVATIWRSKAKSESIAPFSVCWGQSVGFAVNNAANLHQFMQQIAVEHSGNVRTTGPKPPMLAIPDRQPFGESKQLAFQGFIEQLLLDTGWQAGAPTNLWLVGYDPNAAKAAPADATALAQHCAPPAPPSPMPFVIAYGIGAVLIYMAMTVCPLLARECGYVGMSALRHNWKQAAGGLGVIAVGWLLMKAWYQQAQVYNAAKRQWQNTWFCHACGRSHVRS